MLHVINLYGDAIDFSEDELKYFKALKSQFGDDCINDMFEADEFGLITIVKPPLDRQVPMGVVFFLFNVMLNQRIRKLDSFMEKYDVRADL